MVSLMYGTPTVLRLLTVSTQPIKAKAAIVPANASKIFIFIVAMQSHSKIASRAFIRFCMFPSMLLFSPVYAGGFCLNFCVQPNSFATQTVVVTGLSNEEFLQRYAG